MKEGDPGTCLSHDGASSRLMFRVKFLQVLLHVGLGHHLSAQDASHGLCASGPALDQERLATIFGRFFLRGPIWFSLRRRRALAFRNVFGRPRVLGQPLIGFLCANVVFRRLPLQGAAYFLHFDLCTLNGAWQTQARVCQCQRKSAVIAATFVFGHELPSIGHFECCRA